MTFILKYHDKRLQHISESLDYRLLNHIAPDVLKTFSWYPDKSHCAVLELGGEGPIIPD